MASTKQAATTYYHLDILGNTIAASDDSGSLLWRKAYQVFGLDIHGQSNDNKAPGFVNKEYNQDTGLSYFGQRYYEPSLGRFLSIDPVAVVPDNIFSFNRYAYGNNNPYRYRDLDGRFPMLALILIAMKAIDWGMTAYDSYQAYQLEGMAGVGKQVAFAGATSMVPGSKIASKIGGKIIVKEATKSTCSALKTSLKSAQELRKGSTRIGHAISKHAGRNPDTWGGVTGSMDSWNEQGMKHLREIYRAPGEFQSVTNSKNGLTFLEKRLPDGRGVRLNQNHTFKGFID